jgi:phage replication-related protein YjqB (UPF0714/DUF867 family)
MANQQCTPPRLARREFLMAIGAGVPLIATACLEAEFDDSELRNGVIDFEDGPNLPGLNQGLAPPGPKVLNAAVNVAATAQGQSFSNDDRLCSVGKGLAGIMVGDQVRIVRNGHQALYTVAERRLNDDSGTVRMGKDARKRLGTSNPFAGTLVKPVVTSGLTDAQAEAADEFVERLVDNGNHNGLIIAAPHAGTIEFNTHLQAEATVAALQCSSWICKGWKAGGGSYDAWHITSTQVSPRSFPGLGLIANRGFAYGVSYHGMSAGGVLIGGGAPLELKQMVRDAILDELSDGDIEVEIAEPGGYNSGASEKNFINWLTDGGIGGIQIEQAPKVRNDHWQEVANAVINLYSQLI